MSGPSRGRVVYVDANGSHSRPYFVRDACFLAWYERWLDLFIAGTPMFWFGMDNPDYPRDPASSSFTDRQRAVLAENRAKQRYVPAIYSRTPEQPPGRSWWQFWKPS